MLKLICNIVDPKKPDAIRTDAEVNGQFIVNLMVENDGATKDPVLFDTISLEILYNDGPYVVGSDPMARPIPGELARDRAMDAYTREPLRVGQIADAGGPFTNGSLLTLQPRSLEPRGPYKNVTGKAGIKAMESPFELQPGKGPVTVMAGLLYPAAGLTSGTTSMVVTGDVFYKNQPVPYKSVVGKLTVLPRPDGRMHGDSQSSRG